MRFFTYVYVRILNTRQWTSLRVLSTPYVYVGRENAALEINPYTEIGWEKKPKQIEDYYLKPREVAW